jgi:hypothetical protein
MARTNDERRWLTACLIDESQVLAIVVKLLFDRLVQTGCRDLAIEAVAPSMDGEEGVAR